MNMSAHALLQTKILKAGMCNIKSKWLIKDKYICVCLDYSIVLFCNLCFWHIFSTQNFDSVRARYYKSSSNKNKFCLFWGRKLTYWVIIFGSTLKYSIPALWKDGTPFIKCVLFDNVKLMIFFDKSNWVSKKSYNTLFQNRYLDWYCWIPSNLRRAISAFQPFQEKFNYMTSF